jgi:hypothetical protein
MRQSYDVFDELRNRKPLQAFDTVMDAERHFMMRSRGTMERSAGMNDLPPVQAGLAAALRRAFVLPAAETERQFEALLSKLN